MKLKSIITDNEPGSLMKISFSLRSKVTVSQRRLHYSFSSGMVTFYTPSRFKMVTDDLLQVNKMLPILTNCFLNTARAPRFLFLFLLVKRSN